MCRAEAYRLSVERREEVLQAGACRIVAMLTDHVEKPAGAFVRTAWGEANKADVYQDVEARFFKALGKDGEVRRGTLMQLFNPFGMALKNNSRDQKYIGERGIDSNLEGEKGLGDGFTFGGVLVLAPEKSESAEPRVLFRHEEKTFGDHASVDDIIAALKKYKPA
ncbi:hypothetical protein PPROV_000552600 [Pycnococcus provasolii]|uniref:Peroxiredoxin-like 2A n=1 Tax=Pycnococcus provasolii TaxID=41880 RepID=A0A830HIX9_9CHLO|nr:hypothetical protein PPROV_000552600 [Pycnococcus provasolii]|mmetsp:Transcript_11455/g.25723  ORF Transcript_11455/g.25723 Transcript_11455/m.25723 type:complete len:165 (-) Transcript_11455:182-676(-)